MTSWSHELAASLNRWRAMLKAITTCSILAMVAGCASIHPRSGDFSTESHSALGASPSAPAPIAPASREVLSPAPARVDGAGDPPYLEPFFSKEYGHLLLQDVRHVFVAPLDWGTRQWLWAGGAVGGLAAMTLLDRSFSSFIERNHNSTTDSISYNVSRFGAEYSLGVLAAFYVGGQIFDSPKARSIAQDGVAASIIASGIITPTLKIAFGRARHDQGQGPHDFDPFNLDHDSFPSGHTTQAFAVASVVAAHSESIWAKLGAYTAASLVGYARIQRNKHWPTDVAAGALIGTLVGNSVVRFNQQQRSLHPESKASLVPIYERRTVGLGLSIPLR